MAESEGASPSAVEEYQPPEVVDIRVPVPKGLIPSPVQDAKKQRFRRRAILTAFAGLLATGAAVSIAYQLFDPGRAGGYWIATTIVLALSRSVIHWRTFKGDISRSLGYADEIFEAIRICSLGSLLAMASALIASPIFTLRGFLLTEWVMSVPFWTSLLVGEKLVATRLRSKGRNTRQLLVIGNTATSRRLIEQISRHPETGYRLAGVVPFDVSPVPERGRGGGVGKGDRDLTSLIADLFVDDVVFASSVPPHQVIRLLSRSNPRLKVHQVSMSADAPVLRTGENLAGFPVTSLFHPALSTAAAALKRTVDVGIALLGLGLSAPVLLVSMALIRLTSIGPAVFRQTRIGHHGRAFTVYKLRTMRADTDTSVHKEYVRQLMVGAVIEASNGMYKPEQPGVTPLGRILRRLSIDEIPQLWNVLTGSMSIVGPRPPMPYEIPNHDARQLRRLDIKPGLTGLWQVSGRNKLGYREMVELDLRYINNWSLSQDLRIILRTPSAVIRGRQTS